MKFIVNMTTTQSEDFEVDARSEQEAVAIVHEMFNTGDLEQADRPWYDITFTCGNAEETEQIQSLI